MLLPDFDALYACRHEPRFFDECTRALQDAPDELGWNWRRAQLLHFHGMQAEDGNDLATAKARFHEGATFADRAQKEDGARVESAFWSGVCELEAARLGGKLALLGALTRAHKAVARSARIEEGFHFAGPLRVLGRITHLKPLALGGSLDGAIAFYERALQIAPRLSTNNLYLADALLADRQPRRAREALGRVLNESDETNWVWETARDQKIARQWLASRFD